MNTRPPLNGVVHNVCPHDCPDTCSILSRVEGGRLVKISGNPDHPVTRGTLCRKVLRAPERVYAKDRLLFPMMRDGPKGEGKFKRISWAGAIEAITGRWREIVAKDGPHAVLPFFGSGTEGLVHGHIAGRRFFNRLGSLQLDRTICTKAGRQGYQYTMGASLGADPTAIKDCGLIIDWGVNSASTNIHQQTYLKEARRNGARYVVINPLTVSGAHGAEAHIRPRPGSDAALALSMMNVMISEGLIDRNFINNFTTGFEELAQQTAQFTPEAAEIMTGVPAGDIRDLARLYAGVKSSFIYVGPGCQRHSNGGMTLRTLACLPGLTGAWRHPGGGLYFPTSTCFPADFHALEGDDLRPNPAGAYNMIGLGAMLDGPEVKSLYVFNGNPASVLYNQSLVRKGLSRDDLFTVVHERQMTDTARYADIVLPATTQFEQDDLLFSYYHLSLLLNRRAIDPVAECRSNLDTFRALARGMGFEDPCFNEDENHIIEAVLDLDFPVLSGLDREKLYRDGWALAGADPVMDAFKEHRYPTPSGKIEFYSKTMAAAGFDPLPSYTPPRESQQGSPALFERYPLCLLTPSGHGFHNSSYAHEAGFKKTERRPVVVIHPDDAGKRGIEDGDRVRIFNDRGACRLWARVSDEVKRGVVAASGQWWSHMYPDGGNANFTTPDFTADMAGGSAFNSNLVEVEAVCL